MVAEKQKSIDDQLKDLKLVPVVSPPSVETSLRLAEILLRNDLPVAEITLRTNCAVDAIVAMKARFPELLILAGTVLNQQQVDSALAAGAAGIVSPGITSRLTEYCQQIKIPFFPGISTPSEAQGAYEAGLTSLKFFPAEMSGGLRMLALLKDIYPQLSFMPTGGITQDNILEYLKLDNVICCGGTWLSPYHLLESGEWEEIEWRISQAVKAIRGSV